MRSLLLSSAIVLSSITAINVIAPVSVAHAEAPAEMAHKFIKKNKSIKGSYTIQERDGAKFIVFSDDFKAKKGPDLKVFLSPQTIADVSGKTAINGSLNLGELATFKGGQEYKIPSDVDLSIYKSVLVHCEEYSVLWGGANL